MVKCSCYHDQLGCEECSPAYDKPPKQAIYWKFGTINYMDDLNSRDSLFFW